MEGGYFNVDQAAQLGLPAGQYIIQLKPIEPGVANSKHPKLTFTAFNAQATELAEAGKKHVWSYTLQGEFISIIAADLVRAGIHGNLPTRAPELAQALNQQMAERYYMISVTASKKDPARTNTSILGPYTPGIGVQAAPPAAPAPGYAPPPGYAPQPAPAMPVAAPPASAAWPGAPAPVQAPAIYPAAGPPPSVAAPPPPGYAPQPAPAMPVAAPPASAAWPGAPAPVQAPAIYPAAGPPPSVAPPPPQYAPPPVPAMPAVATPVAPAPLPPAAPGPAGGAYPAFNSV